MIYFPLLSIFQLLGEWAIHLRGLDYTTRHHCFEEIWFLRFMSVKFILPHGNLSNVDNAYQEAGYAVNVGHRLELRCTEPLKKNCDFSVIIRL